MLSLLRKIHFNKLLAADVHCQQRLKKVIRTLCTHNYSIPLDRVTVHKDELNKYMAVLPDVVRSLTEYTSKYQSEDAAKFYEKALQYNLPTGKKNYGFITLLAYKELADKAQMNAESIKLAHYLAWYTEMVAISLLMLDDIVDGGVSRGGRPCWYTLEDIGLQGINDGVMMLFGALHILKENFGQKDYYVKLLELFHENLLISTFGQFMDTQISKSCVTSFTMDNYKSIAANKTGAGIYYLVASAMYLCGFTDSEVFKQSKVVLYELGTYFQIDNDFKDCFGDSEKTGKVGTDIQENRCSWLAVVCMERASEAQKEIMRECYGKSDPVKVARVKHLYEELELPSVFASYKGDTINMLKTHIRQDPGSVLAHICNMFVPLILEKNRPDLIHSSHPST